MLSSNLIRKQLVLKAFVRSVRAPASHEKSSVGAEIRRRSRRPNCQPAPARLFVEAVAAFGAGLKEGQTTIHVAGRIGIHMALFVAQIRLS